MKSTTGLKRSGFKKKPVVRVKKKHVKGAKSQADLKKELDRVFSIYIRQLYPKVCYTCGKAATLLQCGHYISRQYLMTRWSIENCRPQCWGCNGFGKGQPLIFEEKLKAEYGNDHVEAMKATRHKMMKVDSVWYQEQITRYKNLVAQYDQNRTWKAGVPSQR